MSKRRFLISINKKYTYENVFYFEVDVDISNNEDINDLSTRQRIAMLHSCSDIIPFKLKQPGTHNVLSSYWIESICID